MLSNEIIETMTGYIEENISVREFQKSIVNANIKVSKKVKSIHPIIGRLQITYQT